MSFKEKLQKVIYSSIMDVDPTVGEQGFLPANISIEYPERQFGDYATPVCMQLAKVLKKSPIAIGEMLTPILEKSSLFSKVDFVKPGFLNFRLSDNELAGTIGQLYRDEDYGRSQKNSNKNVLIEFVSANPTGPLHIGHGRWAAIGDVLGNVLSYSGYNIEREFYVNDSGNQIKNLMVSVDCLRKGEPIPEDGYHGTYMDILKDVSIDPVEYFLNQHKESMVKIGTTFDRYFRESTLHTDGSVEKMLNVLKEKEYAYEKDGALWFASSGLGDDKDRVLKKSDGTYSYFGVDIAYHYHKILREFDILIDVLGADHHGYLGRIKAAVDLLSEKKVTLNVVLGQLVNLFRSGEPVRMSKRTGDMISLDEVVEEIGVDAARYFLTMRSANSTLDFDLQVATQTNSDNPVFYVQYAHARICSIFKKAESEGVTYIAADDFNYADIKDENVDQLVLLMQRFPDEILDMAGSYEIHHLNKYLYELASQFHRFYNKTKIIDSENIERSSKLLYFCGSIKRLLVIGLDLLGISAPETM